MKIIHTSDWHLGARLRHDVSRLEDQKKFLTWLDGVLAEEKPDALLISGDVFDTSMPSTDAQATYYDFLARHIKDEGLRIVVTAGNHDSSDFLKAPDPLLKYINVSVIGEASPDGLSEIVELKDKAGNVELVIAAVPYMNEGKLANLAPRPRPDGESLEQLRRAGFAEHYRVVLEEARKIACGAPVVLMGHGTVSGAKFSDDDSETSRRIGGVDSQPIESFFDAEYVALGHLHLPQPVEKHDNIRYSGTPLAMSFSEAGQQKHIVVVEFGGMAKDPVQIRTIDVPADTIGIVPLVSVKGTLDDIRARLKELILKDQELYVSVLVVDEVVTGIAAFWDEIYDMTEKSKARILLAERENGFGPPPQPSGGVRNQTPRQMAVKCIIESVFSAIKKDNDKNANDAVDPVKRVAIYAEKAKKCAAEAKKYISALDEII